MDRPLSLDSFPSELVTHIASYLCPVEDSRYQKALSRLSQTCRALRDDLQPMLFRAYSHGSRPVSHLIKFLRAIVSRPDLAAAVTKLTFHQMLDYTTLSTTDQQFIETCITDLGLRPPPVDWHLESEWRHTILQTVVAYTPNLQVLEFPVNEERSLEIFESFPDARNEIIFPRLRTLSIYYYYISGDRWGVDYSQVAPLLEASPNLENLALPTLEGFYEGRSDLPALDSVKTLDLGESASGAFFVVSILTRCTSLRKFTLHWLSSTGYDESHEDWSIAEIWDAMVHAKQTLEEITFESSLDIPLGSPTMHSVSSLAGFMKLRVLNVDGRSLEAMFQAWRLKTGGVDVGEFVEQLLPAGATWLTIWDPNHVLIPALLALAGCRARGLYEHLAQVTIGSSSVFNCWMPRPDWSRSEGLLRREFARVGVQLELEIPYIPPEMLNFMMLGGFMG
ncbi:F-box domain protein [Aspergillus terreus]|uniref:F-box domain protein n=1 Tax=Aspergillus terreus TaxID=33178 RepID=A0A5M3YY86_ASPTE|nr:hypothetical protein ATETN484_0006010900 [Aspergillus terreus]GFF19850.1 F-box domain protein [Aspergillus terreus]